VPAAAHAFHCVAAGGISRPETVSGRSACSFDAWTAPHLSATAPALDSTPPRITPRVGSKAALVLALNDLIDAEAGVADLVAELPAETDPSQLIARGCILPAS
jgi:hypothetical protein